MFLSKRSALSGYQKWKGHKLCHHHEIWWLTIQKWQIVIEPGCTGFVWKVGTSPNSIINCSWLFRAPQMAPERCPIQRATIDGIPPGWSTPKRDFLPRRTTRPSSEIYSWKTKLEHHRTPKTWSPLIDKLGRAQHPRLGETWEIKRQIGWFHPLVASIYL